jgi:hypothetical protein
VSWWLGIGVPPSSRSKAISSISAFAQQKFVLARYWFGSRRRCFATPVPARHGAKREPNGVHGIPAVAWQLSLFDREELATTRQ